MKIAILDDWQNVAKAAVDWSPLEHKAELVFFTRAFPNEDATAEALKDFDAIIPMRERTPFTTSLLARLPRLKLIAQTGGRAMTMDLEAATKAGILVCNTEGQRSSIGTAELALGLILATARRIPQGDAAIRAGRFQEGVGIGPVLDGMTLGIIGFGRIGARVGSYGRALGMKLVAWSPNLTAETAEAGGATLVDRDTLLATSDVISLHVVLSARSHQMLGASELARMKPGAILVNTSRGPLVDEHALVAALHEGRIMAGLDVYGEEPLPPDAPIRTAPNCVLTPHLGYGTTDVFGQFYRQSIENILAFLAGTPMRMVNPAAIGKE
jgi:phosphoglycerate dehydrogenase-like enzyme